jgi:protein gp37
VAETAIEWATHVWNPVTGCDRVSPGCAHCYALTYAGRLKAMGQPKYQRDGGKASGPGFGVTLHESALEEPEHWRKPRRVFVNSMSDLFHEDVPFSFIDRVFEAMLLAQQHTFLILTKRAERMREYVCEVMEPNGCQYRPWMPLANVWLGVSIENRRFVHRADVLRETPAAVRFISAEPLLGPLVCSGGAFFARGADGFYHRDWPDGYIGDDLNLNEIDWLIAGGESGTGHRPIDPEWVRALRDRCDEGWFGVREGKTAFFFKQWGGTTPKSGGRELDGRTWDELPARATAGQEVSAHA